MRTGFWSIRMRTGFWSIRMRTGWPKQNRTLEMVQLSSLRPTFLPAGLLSRYETRCLVTGKAGIRPSRQLPQRPDCLHSFPLRFGPHSCLCSTGMILCPGRPSHRFRQIVAESRCMLLLLRRFRRRRRRRCACGGQRRRLRRIRVMPRQVADGHGLGAGGPRRLAVRALTVGRLGQVQAKAEICADEDPFAVLTGPGAGEPGRPAVGPGQVQRPPREHRHG